MEHRRPIFFTSFQVVFIWSWRARPELVVMDDTERIAWLVRRMTFGSDLRRLDELEASGLDATRSAIFDLTTSATSPWEDLTLPVEISIDDSIQLINAWIDHLVDAASPLRQWLTWFWHDYFAVSAPQIKHLSAFARHIELLAKQGSGSFADLVRAVSIDPAMLIFLDGRRNRVGAINENFGRELLELYTIGVGSYDEADVRAAAVALSGWVWNEELDNALFVPRRHDSTPQTLLGATVGDLDSVIDTVTSHPACATYVAGSFAEAVLGAPLSIGDLDVVAERFRSNDLDIASLLTELVDMALDGASTPIVLQPLQWFLHVESMTGASLDARQRLFVLRQMGQVPGVPPNVGGYPDAITWAGPSTTVGRFRAASLVAGRTPDDSALLDRTRARDWDAVAQLTARPQGFSTETLAALDGANTTRRDGREALAAVLMSPELAVG